MINSCSQVTHIDGLVALYEFWFDKITVPQISLKGVLFHLPEEWQTQVSRVRLLLAKFTKLEYMGFHGLYRTGAPGDFQKLLVSGIFDNVSHIQALGVTRADMIDTDMLTMQRVFPNLTAMAIDMQWASHGVVKEFIVKFKDSLKILELHLYSKEDLHFVSEISELISATNVVLKVPIADCDEVGFVWDESHKLCFPSAQEVSIFFPRIPDGQHFDIANSQHGGSDSGLKILWTSEEQDMRLTIARSLRASMPSLRKLYVSFIELRHSWYNFDNFGLRERYSSTEERRMIDLVKDSELMQLLRDLKDAERRDLARLRRSSTVVLGRGESRELMDDW